MPLIDVHCHIDLPDFDGDRETVIRKAKEKGIVALINSGLGSASGRKTLRLAEEFHGYIYSTLGLEPHNLNEEEFREVERQSWKTEGPSLALARWASTITGPEERKPGGFRETASGPPSTWPRNSTCP